MLLSNQQRFLLETLDALGGARMDQLVSLVRSVFCLHKPEIAPRVTEAAIRQMRYCNILLEREGQLVFLPERRPSAQLLEAVDVMLELTGGSVLEYSQGSPPVLLRFCVQSGKMRSFAVLWAGKESSMAGLCSSERLILLFDGQSPPRKLPVSNKQFCAVRRDDGKHRFFLLDGKQREGGKGDAQEESDRGTADGRNCLDGDKYPGDGEQSFGGKRGCANGGTEGR